MGGCSKCLIKCSKPECEVRCPVKHCEKGRCPECETVCKDPKCHTECTNPPPKTQVRSCVREVATLPGASRPPTLPRRSRHFGLRVRTAGHCNRGCKAGCCRQCSGATIILAL